MNTDQPESKPAEPGSTGPVVSNAPLGERDMAPVIAIVGVGCVGLLALGSFLALFAGSIPAMVQALYTPTPKTLTQITWFIGLSSGAESYQVGPERAVVDDFNASQDSIHLNVEIVPNDRSLETFKADIAAGKAPDIVGPTSFPQIYPFHGQWLDLTPYISSADLQPYNPELVKMYKTDEGQIGLPFSVYPSALYYNKALFDAAGLNYPPAAYGQKYKLPDGSLVEWNWDTVAQVARLLTLDNQGRNAGEAGFDSRNIIQYGYTWNFETNSNYIGSFWGGGSLMAGNGKAQLPEAWRAAWEWTYDGIWGERPFIPNATATGALSQIGNAFDTGKVAMSTQPSWLTCCLADLKTWDVAAMPSYHGKVGGRIDIDSFFIWKGSKHPAEAYQVMLYLLNHGARKLIVSPENDAPAFGSISARNDQRQAWIDAQKTRFAWVQNWGVFLAGFDYADLPPAESYVPGYPAAFARGNEFYGQLSNQPNLNMAVEEQKYLDDLNGIFGTGR